MIADEVDFDHIRGNPEFERLMGHASSAERADDLGYLRTERRINVPRPVEARASTVSGHCSSTSVAIKPPAIGLQQKHPEAGRPANRVIGLSKTASSQVSSRIRCVISRSQTLHHFQRGCPINSSRCLIATRTERNQIFVSVSPTFSSLANSEVQQVG